MKKISNWSIFGFILGAGFSLFSAIRYFLIYPDTDRALVYVGIGIMVCGMAFLYNRSVEHGNSLKAVEAYLSDKNFEEKYKDKGAE
jgi:enoyl-CoA hydratase/carnithine racemase